MKLCRNAVISVIKQMVMVTVAQDFIVFFIGISLEEEEKETQGQ